MIAALAAAAALAVAQPAPAAARSATEPAILRQLVAETALAQVAKPDPAWEPSQRDCAGLVRFAYASAFRRLAPERVAAGLWRDGRGRATPFADAETLLVGGSFVALGRDEAARRELESGDLVAYRQGGADDPVYHLMIVVATEDPAHAGPLVVYHPGSPGAAVRAGRLDDLAREAPEEWRPSPDNPSFLGFYRFKEWLR